MFKSANFNTFLKEQINSLIPNPTHMRHLLLLIFFLCLSNIGRAQQHKLDSLENILTRHKTEDTVKLKLLDDLANGYIKIDPQKALEYADQQLALATVLNQKDKLSKAFVNKGNGYLTQSEDSLALKCFQKAYDMDASVNNSEGMGVALYGMGRIHQNRGEYSEAIAYFQKAYLIFEASNNYRKMAAMLNSIGVSQMYSSDSPRALDNFLKIIRIYEDHDLTESPDMASPLGNIGLIYGKMEGKLELALEYHNKALRIHEIHNNKLEKANTLGNIANIYDNMGQPRKAVELQQQAYSLYEELGSKRGMASALTNIGIAYVDIDLNKTVEYLKETLPVYKELDDKLNQSLIMNYLGEVLLMLPHTANSLTEAKNYLEQSKVLAKEVGNLRNESDAYNLLSEVHAANGNYKEAYNLRSQAIEVKNQLIIQESKDEITRLEEQYKYEKKEADIKAEHEKEQALAQAEIDRQKLIKTGSILGGGLLLLTAGFGLLFYKRRRDAVALRQEAEYKATVAETELKALRAQMNPHFIFNSLNSIGDYISKNDTDKAKTYLTKFAKIMRQTLENSNEKLIPLDEDLKLLENYMQMENQRLGNKFSYSIDVDQGIDVENTLVPPMILQPFVENSIWHGISKKEGNGHIAVKIAKENDMLLCVVDDDGVGIQESQDTSGSFKKSLGQNITQKRLEIINRKKPAKGRVDIQNKQEGQGVTVEVRLPLETAF